MSYFSYFPPRVVLLLLLLHICLPSSGSATGATDSDYELSISFAVAENRLFGTAKITIEPDKVLTLSFRGLSITGSLLRYENGSEHELLDLQEVLILPPADKTRTLFLSYEKQVVNEFDNLISPSGISLTSSWYPVPEAPMSFKLNAVLPENFQAVVEADEFPLSRTGNNVTARFSQPATALHFNAGPYLTDRKMVRDGLYVYSMFFQEDRDLAEEYLEAAAGYLNRYEKEIGPFPYNHYVIVANRLPTGYGMPTYTLLGQTVLRLPFIKDTSLGHEIVHSWFGNAVRVDVSEGNWCEGLTAFLADHAYRQEKNEGVADRRESITRYLSYVNDQNVIRLADFGSASHHQQMADAKRAVGYNKGAFVFHELREKIGEDFFARALRAFYADYRGGVAGWTELQTSFEQISGTDLTPFFHERLTRTEIPRLSVENIRTENTDKGPLLSFTLVQKSTQPFSLLVPIEIRTIGKNVLATKEVTAPATEIAIPLDQRPLSLTLDPNYTFLRHLDSSEFPPVWSRFLGAPPQKKLVILAKKDDRARFQPLLEALGASELVVTSADTVSNSELAQHNLLFFGTDQLPSRSLFGWPAHPENGVTVDIRKNPLNRDFVAVLLSASNSDQLAPVAQRLKHYGKYSYMEFYNGRNVVKKISPAISGIHYVIEELPQGARTSALNSFEHIVKQLTDKRVVYIGEAHTSMADHLLQLRILEGLFTRYPKLVVGMEMFPRSSQPVLDKYISGSDEIDERAFLKQSAYYHVWRYDYRYYRDIINFARRHRIPVFGLNLDRQIVSEVFSSGTTDTLDKEVINSLPKDRDLDMAGYTARLSFMHDIHIQGNHGSGGESGFIQAQGLWDETMAENIADIIERLPDHKIVVLAGAQHTRKDSGIPPRVARRVPVAQASVVNINGDSIPADLTELADYYFFSAPASLPELPKIGVVLSSATDSGGPLTITGFSPHGKAEEAGLRVGDTLRTINGFAITEMADLRVAMVDTRKGDRMEIAVSRQQDKNTELELLFSVELTIPPMIPEHP